MRHIADTFIASMSLGLFCLGLNFYIDLHLGYEFVSISISLQVASFLIAIAINRNIGDPRIDVFALVTLCILIASGYILFSINYVNVFSYIIALLCVVVPVVLIGMIVINNGREMSIRSRTFNALAGFCVGVIVAYLVMEREGIWMIFVLSSAALTLAIVLIINISILTKASALFLLAGVLLFANNDNLSSRLSIWTFPDKPVAKSSLSMLSVSEKRGWSVNETLWGKNGRVDIVSTNRSNKEGYFWAVHNANISVPFARNVYSTVEWWSDHYPLMILPFELKKPSKVLTIAAARGADADISQRLYGAETMSIYSDCVPYDDVVPCDRSTINVKLKELFNSDKYYDLVSFSVLNQVATPFVGASASHETIHTIEVFHKLYKSLSDNGLLAINVRDQAMLHKTLSYVWRVLSDDPNENIVNFKNNIRVLMLNQYALHKDTYNYLVLVSKGEFSPEQLHKISDLVKAAPVIKVIYDAANDAPPYNFFKQLDKPTVSSAVSHLTKASSWQYKKNINLEPSTIIKPNYFHLTIGLHPFTSALSAIFLFIGLYGLLFSHRAMRKLDAADVQTSPVLSLLLLQPFLCAVVFVLLLYSMVDFSSASLGYSSQYASTLMIVSLTTFSIPYVLVRDTGAMQKGIIGIWFYPVIILLSVFVLMVMTQDVDMLLGAVPQIVMTILVMSIAFCLGEAHHQAAMFIGRLYSGVRFWFWSMSSVGTMLGLILAKYILIEYDFGTMVRTAMAMLIFMTMIAWWCLTALRDKAKVKADSIMITD